MRGAGEEASSAAWRRKGPQECSQGAREESDLGRMSKKRLKHLLKEFPAITCILVASFLEVQQVPAPEVPQLRRSSLCHIGTLACNAGEGCYLPSDVVLLPRQRWMAEHKLFPPK